MRIWIGWLFLFLTLLLLAFGSFSLYRGVEENRILTAVIERLSADARVAEVVVTESSYDEKEENVETTIKFLEFDALGKPLTPKYFTFKGNTIQFQALVIRFEDELVKNGDKLRGRSAYLFLRAFALNHEEGAQIFDITKVKEVPDGYRLAGTSTDFERKLWEKFWSYVQDANARTSSQVKNAQIEAPGSIFVPGLIYKIRIEHDGGLRVDSEPMPEILKVEFYGKD
ncbi:MAG: hypothetical protein A3G87_00480 [Omnitrophica bacterium RIFCSPLOWO2_12_FULL_50_11]|nr:MAG: hypothetical protein A3G87_00480 [Omnitrophica bacterium RIFCSPLOWO2_12_FULL_50_11]